MPVDGVDGHLLIRKDIEFIANNLGHESDLNRFFGRQPVVEALISARNQLLYVLDLASL